MDHLLLTTTTTMITAATSTATRIVRTTTGVMMFESWPEFEGVLPMDGVSLIVRLLVFTTAERNVLEILLMAKWQVTHNVM